MSDVDGPEPVSLTEALWRLQRVIGTPGPSSVAALRDAWEQVIGARMASSCRLGSIKGTTLVVEATDAAVAEQLRWMSEDLRGAANAVLGSPEIDRVEIRVTGEGEDRATPCG